MSRPVRSSWEMWRTCAVCQARHEADEAGTYGDEVPTLTHPWEDEYLPTWERVRGRVPVEPCGYVWTRRDAVHYLTCGEDGSYTGSLRVPCSRYGSTGDECAPIAYRVSYLTARECGTWVDRDSLDHSMSLVVNDHEDVSYLVRNYGSRHYT